MNICKRYGVACSVANENGYCKSTACTASKTINIKDYQSPIVQVNVVEVSNDSIEKIADAVIAKAKADLERWSTWSKTYEAMHMDTDRKTDNSSENSNNCEQTERSE